MTRAKFKSRSKLKFFSLAVVWIVFFGNDCMKTSEIIRLENVVKTYYMGDQEIKALDGVDLMICKNEYLSIMGPSGSGKTTLLDVLSTMMKPTSGNVFIEGVNTTKMSNAQIAAYRGQKIGFIFQTFNLMPKLTALENVMVPMWINSVPRAEREPRARELLTNLGLRDRLKNRPNQLSGGQQQRVAIARALAMDPGIIVADEPTGNLDTKSGEKIMEILNRLHKEEKRTVIMVTHDRNIGKMADQQIFIKDGKMTKDKKVCSSL